MKPKTTRSFACYPVLLFVALHMSTISVHAYGCWEQRMMVFSLGSAGFHCVSHCRALRQPILNNAAACLIRYHLWSLSALAVVYTAACLIRSHLWSLSALAVIYAAAALTYASDEDYSKDYVDNMTKNRMMTMMMIMLTIVMMEMIMLDISLS